MEESIYATRSDPYFDALVNPSDSTEYGDLIENFSLFLTSLETEHKSQNADTAAVDELVNVVNAQLETLRADIDTQAEELRQLETASENKFRIQRLLREKFSEPVELILDEDEETSPVRVKATLNEGIEQLERYEQTLIKGIDDLEKELGLDIADFHTRLEDLTTILHLLHSFREKYSLPRGSSLVEEKSEDDYEPITDKRNDDDGAQNDNDAAQNDKSDETGDMLDEEDDLMKE